MQRNEDKQIDKAKREKERYEEKRSKGWQKEEKRKDNEERGRTVKQKCDEFENNAFNFRNINYAERLWLAIEPGIYTAVYFT